MQNGIFDTEIDRRGTGAIKWDLTEKLYGSDEVLPMWVADMDLPAPGAVIRALTERLEHPVYGYTEAGNELRGTVCARMKRVFDWDVEPEALIFSPGVVPAMAQAIRALSSPGDGILLQPPVYPPFFDMIRQEGRTLLENPLKLGDDGRWEIDFEDLERKAGQAKLLLFCSPQNPTGRVWIREELERLAAIAVENDLIILSDEIHNEIVYPEHEHIPMAALNPQAAERTLHFAAASKTFNVAGLATSFTLIPSRALQRRYSASLGAINAHPNLFGLTALEAAFASGDDWLEGLIELLDANRKRTVEIFNDSTLPVELRLPESTFLAWLDCRRMEMSDKELARFFANEAKVGLNPGVSFGRGGEGFMRLNFGTRRDLLEEGLARIGKALGRL